MDIGLLVDDKPNTNHREKHSQKRIYLLKGGTVVYT